MAEQRGETFVARAFRRFREKVAAGFARANWMRRAAVGWMEDPLARFDRLQKEKRYPLIVGLATVIWLGLTVWFFADSMRGRVAGGESALQTGLGGLVGGAIFGLVVSLAVAVAIFLLVLLLAHTIRLLASVLLFLPLALWFSLDAAWQSLVVGAKLLFLLPLSVLVVATRLIQLWKGIFYTCPSRACSYRGLPIHVCPDCAEGNRDLWPNLYGLFWHECAGCGRRLPALDVLGRRKLGRRCGGCEMPLLGRHAGGARERLVAIVGGPGSGKTNYLLMAVHEILAAGRNGHHSPLRGELDDAQQEALFREAWQKLERGEPAAKTSEVMKAALLYGSAAGSRCQLYLYDAPGEEFVSISAMTRQQYFPLLEGFILLVDPSSFGNGRGAPLRDVVASTLAVAATGTPTRTDGRMRLRVAVVLSKADLADVRCEIGDVRAGGIEGPRCREAIVRWGGESHLRAIEHRFESVEYFACSALGRTPSQERGAFSAHGVIEPLAWVLTGERTARTNLSCAPEQ